LSAAVARSTELRGNEAVIAGAALLAMIERLHYYMVTGQVALDRDEMLDTLAAVTHAVMLP
jgi:hypothetical protein